MISNLGFEYNKSIVEDLRTLRLMQWRKDRRMMPHEQHMNFHQRSQGNESFDRRNEIEMMILGARKLACDLHARQRLPQFDHFKLQTVAKLIYIRIPADIYFTCSSLSENTLLYPL